MGSFPPSNYNVYIFLCVDYVTKWVEEITSVDNDAQFVANVLKNNAFARFGIP